ncbi:hypothetical protein D3C76_1232880 [compost metagenome]
MHVVLFLVLIVLGASFAGSPCAKETEVLWMQFLRLNPPTREFSNRQPKVLGLICNQRLLLEFRSWLLCLLSNLASKIQQCNLMSRNPRKIPKSYCVQDEFSKPQLSICQISYSCTVCLGFRVGLLGFLLA